MRTEARGDVAVADVHASHRLPWNRYVIFAAIAGAGILVDLGSKEYVFSTLGLPGRSRWEWQLGDLVWFVLQTNLNHGALWGMGQGLSAVFAALSVCAIVGIPCFLFWMRQAHSWWLTIALGFVEAGACGNLYDRLGLHGLLDPRTGERAYAVRDFLYFRFLETFDWPIFNYADSFLVTGAIMLVIHSFLSESEAAPAETLPGETVTGTVGSPTASTGSV
jgi:signal peptidase II